MKKLYSFLVVLLLLLTGCNILTTTYTITFDSNGGTAVSSISTDGKTLGTLPTVEKEGFLFDGWFFDDETFAIPLNVENLIAQNITANFTVYAKWIEDSTTLFTVTFEVDGGSAIDPIQVEDGDTIPSNLVTTKAGFTFDGWYTEENHTTIWNMTDVVSANITLYAKWTAGEYTISFEENGGSTVVDITADFGSAVSAPNAPTKEGHDFEGWYSDTELLTSYTFTTMPAENVTLYAKWSINQYTLSFAENGGSTVVDITADFGSAVSAPSTPSKEGHDFGGWFTDSDFTLAYTFTTIPAENITLFAKWDVLQYSLYFEENGGSVVNDITADFGSAVSAPSTPTKEGYDFEGWYSNSGLNDLYTFTTIPAIDTTLYAKWSINQYSILFEENGGSTVVDITADFGSAVSAPTPPTKEGHDFEGWYSNSGLTDPYTFTTIPAVDTTLYAKWTVKQYTLSFEENGGSEVTNITADFGSDVSSPLPTRTGYTLVGWYTDSGLTLAYTFTTIPAADMTLYAKWSIHQYTLFFEENGGSTVVDITADFGSAVSAPLAPTKAGYEFGGWYEDIDLTVSYTFTTIPAENVTLYAKWDAVEYEITYVESIGATIQEVFVGNGHTFVLTTDNRLIGFGWLGTTYQTTMDKSPAPLDITPMLGLQTNEEIVGFASDNNFFVLTDLGRVLAWGTNGYGAMGDGTNVGSKLAVDITHQFTLLPDEKIMFIRTRYNQSFAVTNFGRLFGWGSNNYGQLGNGTQTDQYDPQDLTAFYNLNTDEKIIDIAVSQINAMVLTNHGNVFTFGFGTNGAIGNNTAPTYQTTPVKITAFFPSGATQIVQVVMGQNYCLALSNSGQVYGFGLDSYAMFGGTENRYFAPVDMTSRFPLEEGDVIVELTTYNNSNAAITASGKVLVWGADFYDMLYDGVAEHLSVIKDITLNIPMPFKTIRFGYSHTVIIGDNKIATHGNNYSGELGRGDYNADQISKAVDLGLSSETVLHQEKFGVNTAISLFEPTRPGFQLAGWYTDAALSVLFNETLMPDHNLTLYAKWEIATYTISFEENGGSEVLDILGAYQDPISEPNAPTKEGYTFDGWFTNPEYSNPFDFTTMPGTDVVLYAKWIVNQYNVTFDEDGGSEVSDIQANFGDGIVPPDAPSKVGHSFGGWFTDKSYTTQYVFTTMPAADITLYAKWDVNQYTISFEENGGSTVDDISYLYQVKISAPVAPTKEGYSFAGWFTDALLNNPYQFTTMPAMDLTLYAKWVEGNPETMIATQFEKTDGTLAEVAGVVYAKSDSLNDGYWIWDETGYLFISGSHQDLVLGDQVTVNGTIRERNGVRYVDQVTGLVVNNQGLGLPIAEAFDVGTVRSWPISNQNIGRLVESQGILMEEEGFYYLDDSLVNGWMGLDNSTTADQLTVLQGLYSKMVKMTYVVTMDGMNIIAHLVAIEEVEMSTQQRAYYIEDLAVIHLGTKTYSPNEEFIIPEADPYGWTTISYTIDSADEIYYDLVLKQFKDTETEVQIIFHVTLTIGLEEFTFDLPIILKPKTVTAISAFNTGVLNQLYTVKGIVVSSSEVFAVLKDDTGTTFFFNNLGLEVGDEVILTSKRVLYNNMAFLDTDIILEEKISEGNDLNLEAQPMTLDAVAGLNYLDPAVYGEFVEIRGNLMTSSFEYHEFYALINLTSIVPVYPFGHSSFENLLNYEYYEIILRGFLFDNGNGQVGLLLDGSRGDIALPDYDDAGLVEALRRMAEIRFNGVEFTSLEALWIPATDIYLGGTITYEMDSATASLFDETTKTFAMVGETLPISIVFTITEGLASATYTYNGYLNPLPVMGLSDLQAVYNYERVYVQGTIVYRHPNYAYMLGVDGKLLFIDIDQLDAYVGDEVILCVSKRTNYNGQEIYVARDESIDPIVMMVARNQSVVNPLTETAIADLVDKDPTVFETFTQRVEVEGVISYRTSNQLMISLVNDFIVIDHVDFYSFHELEQYVGKRVKVRGYMSEYDSYNLAWKMRYTGLETDVREMVYTPQDQIALVKADLINRYDVPVFEGGQYLDFIHSYPGFADISISYEVMGENAALVNIGADSLGTVTQPETILINVMISCGEVLEEFQIGIHIGYEEMVFSTIEDALLSASSVLVEGKVITMTEKQSGALALIEDATGLLYVMLPTTYYSNTLLGKTIQVKGQINTDHNRKELVAAEVAVVSGATSLSPTFTVKTVAEIAAMDQLDQANYGMAIQVTGRIQQVNGYLFIEADGVKIAISSFSNAYWYINNLVGLQVQIRGFFVGDHPKAEFLENSIIVDNASYDSIPSYQAVGYDEAAKVAYMKELFLGNVAGYNPPLWPNETYWVTKARVPFQDVTYSYQILTNAEYAQYVSQAPYGDDYLLIKLAPQDVVIKVEVTFTCGLVTDTAVFNLYVEGFTVGSFADLFVADELTTQIALEATVIYQNWGYFYLLIEDQVYYVDGLYEWYSQNQKVYIIGRKDTIDGAADYTYHIRLLENGYEEVVLTPLTASIADIYVATDLSAYRQNMLKIAGTVEYDEGLELYYLENAGNIVYLRSDFGTSGLEPNLYSYVEVNVLFSGKTICGEYYLVDYMNGYNDVTVPDYTNEERFALADRFISEMIRDVELISGEYIENMPEYHNPTGVVISYQLADPLDGAHFDFMAGTALLVDTTQSVDVLVTYEYLGEVIGTRTITLVIQPREIEPIHTVLYGPNNAVFAFDGVIETILPNQCWVVSDGTGNILVDTYYLTEAGLDTGLAAGDEVRILGVRNTFENRGFIPIIIGIDVEKIGTGTSSFAASPITFEEVASSDYTLLDTMMQEVTYTGIVVVNGEAYGLQQIETSSEYIVTMMSPNPDTFNQEMYANLGSLIEVTGYLVGLKHADGYFDWMMIVTAVTPLV